FEVDAAGQSPAGRLEGIEADPQRTDHRDDRQYGEHPAEPHEAEVGADRQDLDQGPEFHGLASFYAIGSVFGRAARSHQARSTWVTRTAENTVVNTPISRVQ